MSYSAFDPTGGSSGGGGGPIDFNNLTGNIAISQMNMGTGATNHTFWRGDDVWATPAVSGGISIVNPMNFGAFADGTSHPITAQDIIDHSAGGSKTLWVGTIARTVTTGMTTSGSQTITDTSGSFNSVTDVGQRIEGVSGGVAAFGPGSRISQVFSATSAQINCYGFGAYTTATGVTFTIGDYIAGDQWDYVALQEAIYAAFQNGTINPNKTSRWLNKQLYIPAGRYLVNKAPTMYEVQGGVVFGDGRLTTQINSIRAGFGAWECNGLWFTQFTGIQWFTANGNKSEFPLFLVDGNWDGKHTQGVQGNTWKDCHWDASFTIHPCLGMCYHGTNSQGSENLWLDCHFNNPATVINSNAVKIYTYNALQNTFIGGNFSSHVNGVGIQAGSANLNSVGFQAIKPQQQDLQGYDVWVANSANAHVAMTNCRSESTKSVLMNNGVVFTADSNVIDMAPPQGTWAANYAYAQGASTIGITGGHGNGHLHRCVVAGISGATEPVWNDNDGNPTVEILDGGMTSGSTTLTTGGFVNMASFMPGRGIMVVGAGVSGANLYTTIVSAGSSSAVLTAAASTTVSSARAVASPITTDGTAQWIHDEYNEATFNAPSTLRNCSFRFGRVQSVNNTWPSVFEHCNFARSDWAFTGAPGITPNYNGYRLPVTTTLDGKIATVNQITLNGGYNDGVAAVLDATPSRVVALTTTTGTQTVPMDRDQVQITPTGDCTFNAGTGIAAGYRTTFLITTSGTTSRTLTWGTGFKSTGTLATGTVSGKVFTVTFTLGGGNWNETSRTGPL
jgi:hypothetical protein